MKKIFSILALTAVLALTGCGGASVDSSFGQAGSSNEDSSVTPDGLSHEHTDDNDDGKCDECSVGIQATLEFFSVNDLHGKFQDTDSNCGVDELTTYLRNKQSQNPNTVLLSAGDMWQGSPESNLTHGNIITDWMNDLSFTAMTLGNHEFDWGEEYIEQNAELAEFPILGINVYDPDTNERETYAQPSVLIQKSGVKIGVIGAIGDCISSIAADKTTDIDFKTDDELTALVKAESTRLRDLGADVIVYSLHDAEVSNTHYYDEELSNGYVDLVFEGHSHTVVQKKDKYGVWHLQAGGDNTTGISYAKMEVDLTKDEISVNSANIVNTGEYANLPDDPIVQELLDKYADQISKMDEVLGMNDNYRNSDALKNFAAEAMFKVGYERWNSDERYHGKIVLGGGYLNVRSPYNLDAGKVTYGDIQSLFPFDNYVVLCKVTGVRLLEQFINSYNYTCFYGEEGSAIKNNVSLNETYYVVVDTYCANFDFHGWGWLEIVEYYDQANAFYTRDALAEFIKGGGMSAITPTKITSIPEILAIGNSLPQGQETADKFRTVGKIINIDSTFYGNMTIEDEEGNQLYIYGTFDLDGNRYNSMPIQPQVGDVVTLDGKIKNYYNYSNVQIIELVNAIVVDIQDSFLGDDENSSSSVPDEDPDEEWVYTPIHEILSIGNSLPENGVTEEDYVVKATIIDEPTQPYGNTTVRDIYGFPLYIYGMRDTDNNRYDAMPNPPTVGDEVVLQGKIKNYYTPSGSQIIEMISATVLEIIDSTPDEDTVTLSTLALTSDFGGSSISEYTTGNYGQYSVNGVSFEYYRAYKTADGEIATLLPYTGFYSYDAQGGSLYNVTPIYGIRSFSITYKSDSAAVFYTGDDRLVNSSAHTLPKSTSYTTVNYDVDTDNFFTLVAGNSSITIDALSFEYTNVNVSYDSQKDLSGSDCFRMNAITFDGTLVAGESSVSVPVKVEYDGGRYAITQTKTYTYYTLEYVEAHPEIKDEAAMIAPADIAAYYTTFKQFPANFAAKTKNLKNTCPSFDEVQAVFGEDTRYVSKYSRTNGYAQYVPYNPYDTDYYEFDVALDSSYWEKSDRGVGRVVAWEAGWVGKGYDSAPACVFTDDHYASFQEYLNTGDFGKRFDAEMSLTYVEWSAPDTVTAF